MITMKRFMGGGLCRQMSQDLHLVRGSSRVQVFEPDIVGLYVNLPRSSTLLLGGPQFYIVNASLSFDLNVNDGDGRFLLRLMPEEAAIFCLIRDTTNSHWLTIKRPLMGRTEGLEV